VIDDALLDAAQSYARRHLSDKRYAHTLRVADTAERLSELHALDSKKTRLAALLHDAAREVGKDELLRVAGEEGIAVSEFEREQPVLLHGPVAAKLARRELRIEDAEVLDAIRVHTIGEPGMSPIALALYVADKIEPDREGARVEDLRKLAPEDLRKATAAALEGSISYNERRGHPTHPKSLQTLKWLESSGYERPG
jgi:predicted HD superfamily hydrolase involved in NAD metabolism